jgi:nitrate reductase delta subunit
MADKRQLLDSLARLFAYPSSDFSALVAACRTLADARSPGRGEAIADLEERARGMSRGEVEEMFTRTFEINPVCALEIGWHIYGEDYARGALLVRLRQELRAHDLPEITELPDHLTHVLPLLARLEKPLADDLAGRYVLPALRKMIEAVKDSDCPYTGLLEMTRDLVDDEFDAVEIEPPARRQSPPGSKGRRPVLMPVVNDGACGPGGCGVGAGPSIDDERGGSWS